MGANDYTDDDSMRTAYPYVMTNQGPRRKIGSRARYGMNPRTGDAPTATRLGSEPSRLGKAPHTQGGTGAMLAQQAAEQSAANAAYLKQKEKGGTLSLASTLGSARALSRKAKQKGTAYSKGKIKLL